MLAGKSPHVAIQMLYELNILKHSLKFPETCKNLSEDNSEKEIRIFESVKLVQTMYYLYEHFLKNPLILGQPLTLPDKVDLFYLSLILSFIKYKYTQKGRVHDVYDYIINTGLKVSLCVRLRKIVSLVN